MYEEERSKIRAEIDKIKQESAPVNANPASAYAKLRAELNGTKDNSAEHASIYSKLHADLNNATGEKVELQDPIIQNNEEIRPPKKAKKRKQAQVDPAEETGHRVESIRADGTKIIEDGDDIIYEFKDDEEPGQKEPEDIPPEDAYVQPDMHSQDNYSPDMGNGNNGGEPTPADQDQEGFKSEIAKQLFDVPRKKILQRTELPKRMILPMSMQKTAIFLATQTYHPGCETGPEHWMHEYGYLMLSAGRKVRIEGMAAFQPVAEGGGAENINF
jgi:hypothetical protein